jgi:hypothetical protein
MIKSAETLVVIYRPIDPDFCGGVWWSIIISIDCGGASLKIQVAVNVVAMRCC